MSICYLSLFLTHTHTKWGLSRFIMQWLVSRVEILPCMNFTSFWSMSRLPNSPIAVRKEDTIGRPYITRRNLTRTNLQALDHDQKSKFVPLTRGHITRWRCRDEDDMVMQPKLYQTRPYAKRGKHDVECECMCVFSKWVFHKTWEFSRPLNTFFALVMSCIVNKRLSISICISRNYVPLRVGIN